MKSLNIFDDITIKLIKYNLDDNGVYNLKFCYIDDKMSYPILEQYVWKLVSVIEGIKI